MAYHAKTQQLISWLLQDPPEPVSQAGPARSAVALTTSDWSLWLHSARHAVPDAQLRLVTFRKTPTDAVHIRIRLPQEWHPNGRSVIRLAPDGSLLSVQRATDLAPGLRVNQLVVFGIHSCYAAVVCCSYCCGGLAFTGDVVVS